MKVLKNYLNNLSMTVLPPFRGGPQAPPLQIIAIVSRYLHPYVQFVL